MERTGGFAMRTIWMAVYLAALLALSACGAAEAVSAEDMDTAEAAARPEKMELEFVDGEQVKKTALVRTARRLMEGYALVPDED